MIDKNKQDSNNDDDNGDKNDNAKCICGQH